MKTVPMNVPRAVVNDLRAAREWFLRHATGQVTCWRPDGTELVCDSYPEAERFYQMDAATNAAEDAAFPG